MSTASVSTDYFIPVGHHQPESPMEIMSLRTQEDLDEARGCFTGTQAEEGFFCHPSVRVANSETATREDGELLRPTLERLGIAVVGTHGPILSPAEGIYGHPGVISTTRREDAGHLIRLIQEALPTPRPLVSRMDLDENHRSHWWRYLPNEVLIVDAFTVSGRALWFLTYPPQDWEILRSL